MKILFQGDSITDVGRNAEMGSTISIGQGYAVMVTGELGLENPGKYEFINRGISGNRIVDLYARIKADVWNLEPDVMTILLGVNDVWHEIMFDNGVDNERFYEVYELVIKHTLERFPEMKMMLLEPFVLDGSSTHDNFESFYRETKLRAESVKKLAEKYGLVFIPLQEDFEKLCEKAPASYWLADGVHPTPAGHRMIADKWINAFRENILK